MPDAEVALARLWVFHHHGGYFAKSGQLRFRVLKAEQAGQGSIGRERQGREIHTHIRKATSRQAHSSRAHKGATHNKEIRMRIRHRLADGANERKNDKRSNGMGDERRDDQNKRRENNKHSIEIQPLNASGDSLGDSMQKTRRRNSATEREPAGSEEDDGPEEVIEVLLSKNTSTEKQRDGKDGDDAHVAEDAFELVRDAPQCDGGERDAADEPLHAGEAVFHGADGDDGRAFAGLEGEEEEHPDQEDGDDADGERDEEPCYPAGFGGHVLQGDDVLRRGDGGGGAADVGG